jgi:biopolymer transport protein ExbB/TolQ
MEQGMTAMLDPMVLSALPVADIAFAFRESNMAGKIIVILLFMGSIFAWSIMVNKWVDLRRAQRASDRFVAAFRRASHPSALFLQKQRYPESPLYRVYENGCMAIGVELEWGHGDDEDHELGFSQAEQRLTARQIDAVRNMADRTVADQMLLMESYMGYLATSVSASPFLGLLGTVWGVMAAFSGMAVMGSSTLSAVAPGIAGALLTTVVGLLVALPSSVGYNALTNKIRSLHVQTDNFAQEFVAEVQRYFMKE